MKNTKKIAAVIAALSVASSSLSGCGSWVGKAAAVGGEAQAEGMAYDAGTVIEAEPTAQTEMPAVTTDEGEETDQETETTEPEQDESAEPDTQGQTSGEDDDTQDARLVDIGKLTEGEIEARLVQQANFAEARETLYGLENSKDKTEKINQMDRQILANNAYDFSEKNIVFIGDSITEGIKGAVGQNGDFIGYVTYADSYLHFKRALNHGKGGRMFTDYGGEEASLHRLPAPPSGCQI